MVAYAIIAALATLWLCERVLSYIAQRAARHERERLYDRLLARTLPEFTTHRLATEVTRPREPAARAVDRELGFETPEAEPEPQVDFGGGHAVLEALRASAEERQ